MRVGVNLPQYEIDFAGGAADSRALLRYARRAVDAGFDSVWVSDHLFARAPDGSTSGVLAAGALLPWLASSLSFGEIGALVLASTMRDTDRFEQAARALAVIAPGRITLGVGLGWYADEHRAFGVPLPDLRARADAVDHAMRAGARAQVRVLAGGGGSAMLGCAARAADVWNLAWDPLPDVFQERSAALDAACRRHGREPGRVARSVGVTVAVATSDAALDEVFETLRARAPFLASLDADAVRARIIAGTPPQVSARIAAYAADEVVVTMLLRDDLGMLELFAERVLPALTGRAGRR